MWSANYPFVHVGMGTGFVHLSTPMESWDTKLSLILTSVDKKLSFTTSDWTK